MKAHFFLQAYSYSVESSNPSAFGSIYDGSDKTTNSICNSRCPCKSRAKVLLLVFSEYFVELLSGKFHTPAELLSEFLLPPEHLS